VEQPLREKQKYFVRLLAAHWRSFWEMLIDERRVERHSAKVTAGDAHEMGFLYSGCSSPRAAARIPPLSLANTLCALQKEQLEAMAASNLSHTSKGTQCQTVGRLFPSGRIIPLNSCMRLLASNRVKRTRAPCTTSNILPGGISEAILVSLYDG